MNMQLPFSQNAEQFRVSEHLLRLARDLEDRKFEGIQ